MSTMLRSRARRRIIRRVETGAEQGHHPNPSPEGEGEEEMTPAARLQTAIEILDAIAAAAREGGPPADAIFAAAMRARRYRSEEPTSELPSLKRLSYAVFCSKT